MIESPYANNMNSSSSDEETLSPSVEITEQPKARGYRFRYGCEGKTAGSLLGEKSLGNNKTSPSIKVKGVPPGCPAIVVVSCVTAEEPYRPHPHKLVGKDCDKGVCTVSLKRTNNLVLQHLGIQCVKKKEVPVSLMEREKIKVDPFQGGYYDKDYNYDMKKVRLCIQAFLKQGDVHIPLPPVVTNPIYDQKTDNELVISRIDRSSGYVKGGEEVFLLCEKISKDDILVQFYEETNGVVWEAWGEFNPNDVHKQFAIVFKTPPYKDQSITNTREVSMRLYRPSDETYSEGKNFIYKPNDPDRFGVGAKRKRKHGFQNVNAAASNVPALAAFQSPKETNSQAAQIAELLRRMQQTNTTGNALTRAVARTSTITSSSSPATHCGVQYPKLEPESDPGTPRLDELMPHYLQLVTSSPAVSASSVPIPAVVDQLTRPQGSSISELPSTLPTYSPSVQPQTSVESQKSVMELLNSITSSDPGLLSLSESSSDTGMSQMLISPAEMSQNFDGRQYYVLDDDLDDSDLMSVLNNPGMLEADDSSSKSAKKSNRGRRKAKKK